MPISVDYAAIVPELVVGGSACVVLIVDLFARRNAGARVVSAVLALLATLAALAWLLTSTGETPKETLNGSFALDGFAVVLKAFFLAAGAFAIFISIPPMRAHRYEGEYYFLVLCSIFGTMLMASSRDLLMLFISLELVSVPAFVIAGLRKHNPRSNEAALKFFLIGVLSAAVFVYGISLVYGITGSTSLEAIATATSGSAQGAADGGVTAPPGLLLAGLVMIVAAFGFKVSAVPFHFWAPDTYEGSPTPLAAFLAVASKAAGFTGLLLVLLVGFANVSRWFAPLIGGLAIATMTLGNVMALRQRHLIRLLAYSSIGHAGYMLIPLAIIQPYVGEPAGGANAEIVRSLVTYVLIYGVMNFGAFSVAIALSKGHPTLLLRDLTGFARRAPFQAFAMAAFMISLGGIPPFAGWFAKFAVFIAAVNRGSTLGVVLAVAMVVNSVISLYYYVNVVRMMYLREPEEETVVQVHPALAAAVAACVAAITVLGVFPEPFAQAARAARVALFG